MTLTYGQQSRLSVASSLAESSSPSSAASQSPSASSTVSKVKGLIVEHFLTYRERAERYHALQASGVRGIDRFMEEDVYALSYEGEANESDVDSGSIDDLLSSVMVSEPTKASEDGGGDVSNG